MHLRWKPLTRRLIISFCLAFHQAWMPWSLDPIAAPGRGRQLSMQGGQAGLCVPVTRNKTRLFSSLYDRCNLRIIISCLLPFFEPHGRLQYVDWLRHRIVPNFISLVQYFHFTVWQCIDELGLTCQNVLKVFVPCTRIYNFFCIWMALKHLFNYNSEFIFIFEQNFSECRIFLSKARARVNINWCIHWNWFNKTFFTHKISFTGIVMTKCPLFKMLGSPKKHRFKIWFKRLKDFLQKKK